jgi:ribosomal protein S18 acetylase RimI-like enzyme
MGFEQGRPRQLRANTALKPHELEAVAELDRICTDHGDGRLKLEFPTLRARRGHRPSDFTWWEDDTLLGFLGIYQWRSDEAEITGMVHPGHRRQGIFTQLYDDAVAELERRRAETVLLVTDRSSAGGQGFARHVGATYEHSEHRMVQTREPDAIEADPALVLRPATFPKDAEFIADCIAAAFELPRREVAVPDPTDESEWFLVVERGGTRVGTLRVNRSDDRGTETAGIYGFAILPDHQGQGIGRRVLSSVVRSLRDDGVEKITLEVAVNNDAALKVYETCGFERIGTDDYFRLPGGSRTVPAGDEAERSLHPAAGR